ncbi:cytochrome b N-terminal domain-containing protein [Myxococcaceae bacterium GXIMD 01537]
MLKPLADWLESRIGLRGLLHAALYERIPGGARWAYVFGSALLVLFLVQGATGLALELYYSPSTTDAWASVNYIETKVWLGSLLRGMHHWGASAIVVMAGLHVMQTAWAGAFRAPRELNWLTGFILLQLILAFALTGYLLPWDQKGYWATQVATSIAGTLPWLGPKLQVLLQGGASYGNLTLTRFHAIHVVLLPAALVLFLVAHVTLFRRHGVTPRPLPPAELDARAELFFPGQLLRDTAFAAAVVCVLFALAWRHGAPLGAPADAASQYLARPEWYFLPLFQLLKYFEGSAEWVGTTLVPTLAMAFLAGMPFLAPVLERRRLSFRWLSGALTVGLVGVAALGVLAVRDDAADPNVAAMAERARVEAAEARRLAALGGVPTAGPLELYRNDAAVWGARVFAQHCQSCHTACDARPFQGSPCLEGYASRTWISRLLREPRAPHFFGNTSIDAMDPYTGDEESLAALVEFIYSQGGSRPDAQPDRVEQGRALFESEGCASCHTLDGQGSGLAPDLFGWAGREWLAAFIRSPGAPRFYGDMNEMDAFDASRLSDAELQAVVTYLHSQAQGSLKIP